MQSKKQDFLNFFKIVGKSKRLPRTGWAREKVKNPESAAEHSFRVGVFAMMLAERLGVDKDKLMKMALIHDLGAALTEDMVWIRWGVVDLKARDRKEREEIKGIVSLFNDIEGGNEYIKIFEEMTLRSSKEAKIFWQVDKLEMALQALEYEQEQRKNLEEFFATADLYIKHPVLREMFEEILSQRENKKGVIINYESI